MPCMGVRFLCLLRALLCATVLQFRVLVSGSRTAIVLPVCVPVLQVAFGATPPAAARVLPAPRATRLPLRL